jgi:hypothetical protein
MVPALKADHGLALFAISLAKSPCGRQAIHVGRLVNARTESLLAIHRRMVALKDL